LLEALCLIIRLCDRSNQEVTFREMHNARERIVAPALAARAHAAATRSTAIAMGIEKGPRQALFCRG
jgi:hypothetical protein